MDAREVKDAIEELEPKVERLRALYKQYFLGYEKIPPHVLRKDVDRTIYRLRRARFNQTRLKFKFNQIVARYNTYSQFWARTMREIERGTYKRDIRRAAQRMGSEEALAAVGRAARAALRAEVEEMPAPPTWTLDSDDADAPPSLSEMPEFAGAIVSPGRSRRDEDDPLKGRVRKQSFGTLDLGPLPSAEEMASEEGAAAEEPPEAKPPPPAKTRAMPPPPKRPPPPLRPPGAPGRPPPGRPPPKRDAAASDDRHRSVYQEYLKARRASGNHNDVSYDKVAKTLEQQAARIRAKHGNRDIDFKVVTKDGKAVIRPVLKK